MNNPQDIITILAGVLAIFWAFPLVRLLSSWLEDRTIDGRLVLATFIAHLTIIALLLNYANLYWLVIYLGAVTLLWVMTPFINAVGERMALRQLRNDDMVRYQQMLDIDPNNAAAYSAIADIYVERRQFANAVAAYEQAIEIDPAHTRAERWKLKHAREMMERFRQTSAEPNPTPIVEPAVERIAPATEAPQSDNVLILDETPPAPEQETLPDSGLAAWRNTTRQ